MLGMAMPPRLA
jgi:hypothetical protein